MAATSPDLSLSHLLGCDVIMYEEKNKTTTPKPGGSAAIRNNFSYFGDVGLACAQHRGGRKRMDLGGEECAWTENLSVSAEGGSGERDKSLWDHCPLGAEKKEKREG